MLILIALISGALNLDATVVNDIHLWARLAIPAALLVGLAGTRQTQHLLSILTAVVAWGGIGLFFLVVILTILPGEWSRLVAGPQGPPVPFLALRFALLLALDISVAVVFSKLTGLAVCRNESARD